MSMSKDVAAAALVGHLEKGIEQDMLRVWASFSFSNELHVQTKLLGIFRGRWGNETGPAKRVKDFVRIVSQDNDIAREILAEEVVKILPEPAPHPKKGGM